MTLRPPGWPALVAGLLCLHGWAIAACGEGVVDAAPRSSVFILAPTRSQQCPLDEYRAGQTVRLLVNLESPSPDAEEHVLAELAGPGIKPIRKELYAGDPDWYLTCRPSADGPLVVTLGRGEASSQAAVTVRVEWRVLPLADGERLAIEAEPNDRWQDANPLQLGGDVHGTADDVDYLTNNREGTSGLDWFKFQVEGREPILVYFWLDLLDRDVSANLRVYAVDSEEREGNPLPAR